MQRLFIALLFVPNITWAEPNAYAQCQFTSECFDGESCAETNFEVTVIRFEGYGNYGDLKFVIESEADDVDGFLIDDRAEDGVNTMIGKTETAYHMLSIGENGDARYTVHMQGPLAVTYLGSCGGTP